MLPACPLWQACTKQAHNGDSTFSSAGRPRGRLALPMSRQPNLLSPGERVGSWEVEGKLGFGTYSEIYTALHVVTRARAALKVDKGAKDSLDYEASILARLQKYPLVGRSYGVMCVAGGGQAAWRGVRCAV